MNENYEVNEIIEETTETMNEDLLELLQYLKEKILETDAEQTEKKGNSKFSQYTDAFDKFYKLYQTDLSQELDEYIKTAEKERKNCEYLEAASKNTRELELKKRELELKEREIALKELSAEESARWWNKPILQTALACGTVLAIDCCALVVNTTEFPLKNIVERWMAKPNIKL